MIDLDVVSALIFAVVALSAVAFFLGVTVLSLIFTRPVTQRRAPANGELDWGDMETTGIRKMKGALERLKPPDAAA